MKTSTSKRLFSLLLALVLCLSLVVPVSASESNGTSLSFEQVDNSVVSSSLLDARKVTDGAATQGYRQSDRVRVSIVLDKKSTIEEVGTVEDIAENEDAIEYRDQLQEQQDELVDAIREKNISIDVAWNLTLAANIISGEVRYGSIEDILELDGVSDVIIETRYEPDVVSKDELDPNMATSSEMIGSTTAWANGYTGAGSRIAVIDTGTDTDHQSFNSDAFLYAIQQTGKDVDLMDADDIAKVLDQLNIAELVEDAESLYLNAKLPFAYNYVDEDFEVTHDNDSQGEHGSHVAGIATANRYIKNADGTYSDALTVAHTQGVAPDAQLITMKVFGKKGGAYDSDYMAAIEDAIILGADSINLSLGSGNPGFSYNSSNGYTDGGTSYQDLLDALTEYGAVVCISAGNSGTWQENTFYANYFGTGYLYNDGVSMQTDGSPGSYTNAFTVASADNIGGTGNFFTANEHKTLYTESTDYGNVALTTLAGQDLEYVFIDGIGTEEDFAAIKDVAAGKVVFVSRGTTSFFEKANFAAALGAAATIIYNNTTGTIGLMLTGYEYTAPCVSILQSDALAIKEASTAVTGDDGSVLYYTGKFSISDEIGSVQYDSDYITMSSFSSWGTPGSLQLKPEITAPGGNIYSVNGAVAGGEAYENMSGTSMASPQVAGMVALMAQYIRENGLTEKTDLSARQLAQSLLMSTAEPLIEEDSGSYYSVLNQGAGLANVGDAINAHSYITMDEATNSGATDGKVKVELGDDPTKTGVYTFTYTLHNTGSERSYFELDTDVFTQDVFGTYALDATTYGASASLQYFLDTWTTPLTGATVSYKIDNEVLKETIKNGKFTEADAQKALNYATGAGSLDAKECEDYDIDNDGFVTSYDAHLILMMAKSSGYYTAVDADQTITVTVTIDVTKCDFSDYPNGAYIEAYSYAREFSTEEGVLGTTHSIPVLGYYGNWSDPSMYDEGTLIDYIYGEEEHFPYLYQKNGFYGNLLSVKYPGDNTEYYFTGNPVAYDDEYLEERNAFNSNGSLAKYYASVVRNAGAAMWQITDVETGDVYAGKDLGSVNSAYYYSNGSAWYNAQSSVKLEWDGTDADGKKLAEDTQVDITLVMAPEYYRDEDGTYGWDTLLGEDGLGKGAYMTTRIAIDNTAPEMTALSINEDGGLVVTAYDNRYLACVALYMRNEADELDYVVPNQEVEDKGKSAEYTLDISELKDGAELYVQLTDYAMNQSTYKFVLKESGVDQTKVAPTSITLPETLTVIKNTTVQLTPEFEPHMAKEEVTWTSGDENIATVNENGIVTGVTVGETTVTATSKYDETVFATCAVIVKTYDVTLTGALQDEDGQPQLFTWDIGDEDASWVGGVELKNDINAVAYDWMNEVMYQVDTDGDLHKVDVATGDTIEDGAAQLTIAVDDIDMSYMVNHVYEKEYVMGIYGSYILYSDGMNNFDGYGWNYAGKGVSNFTSIAWAGYMMYPVGDAKLPFDIFYLTDDANNMWMVALDVEDGYSLSFDQPDYPIDNFNNSFPGSGGAYYCSMVMGDDYNFYLSYFNGSTNEIYVMEDLEEGDESFSAALLGDVGDKVWPAGLLAVAPNSTETEDPEETLASRVLDIDVTGVEVAEAEKITLGTANPTGGLNSLDIVDVVKSALFIREPVKAGQVGMEAFADIAKGKVYVRLNANTSTNAVVNVDYDSRVLTFNADESTLVYEENEVINSLNPVDGTVTVGFASRDEYSGKVATLIFDYNPRTCPSATQLTLTPIERNDEVKVTTGESKDVVVALEVIVPQTNVGSDLGLFGGSASGSASGLSQFDLLSQYYTGVSFSDVTANSWYYDYVTDMANAGVINGYPDGTFRPQGEVTWGEALKLTAKACGYGEFASDGSHWASGYLLWAKTNLFVSPDAVIDLDAPITRGEMADLLANAMKLAPTENSYPFEDEAPESAIALYAAGIITGSLDDGHLVFRANSTITRAEMAAIIWRVYNK